MRRRLKIAVSVFFTTLCVVTVFFWIRSYWVWDAVWIYLGNTLGVQSAEGKVQVLYAYILKTNWYVADSTPLEELWNDTWVLDKPFRFSLAKYSWVILTHSILALHFALFALLPWVQWSKQYRMRTLLALATYVAVVCGIVASWRS